MSPVHSQLKTLTLREVLYAWLAVNKRIQERPAHTDCCGTKCNGLQYIRPALKATVDINL